jgi:glycosidase
MVSYWMKEIGIDGWRLDVAYLLPIDFIKELRKVCDTINPESFLIGELIHPPYSKWIGEDRLHSGTAYNVYKSIWSAIASSNMYELKAVLEQSFHPEWGQIKDQTLMNFLGNHDNTRIASILPKIHQLKTAFTLLFTLNGIPKIYYGDELATLGIKTEKSDDDVRRPMVDVNDIKNNKVLSFVQELIKFRQENHALIYGRINGLYADPASGKILSFLRQSSKQSILVVINSGEADATISLPFWNLGLEGKRFKDLSGNDEYTITNNQLTNLFIPKKGNRFLEML